MKATIGLLDDVAERVRVVECSVDALRKDDLERARSTAPGEKLRQALELMQLGIDMQRRRLRAADPTASEMEIDARILAWMSAPR